MIDGLTAIYLSPPPPPHTHTPPHPGLIISHFSRDSAAVANLHLPLPQRLAGATLLVFANKQDLAGALSREEIRSQLQLSAITTHHWRIVSCSAVTGENLVTGVDWLLDDIAARIFDMD